LFNDSAKVLYISKGFSSRLINDISFAIVVNEALHLTEPEWVDYFYQVGLYGIDSFNIPYFEEELSRTVYV